jgi:hypothetical protein
MVKALIRLSGEPLCAPFVSTMLFEVVLFAFCDLTNAVGTRG